VEEKGQKPIFFSIKRGRSDAWQAPRRDGTDNSVGANLTYFTEMALKI